jgi:hypothetical protein
MIPGNYLLRTLGTTTGIIRAVYWRLGSSNGNSGGCSCDLTIEAMHIHVRYSTEMMNPQPSTYVTTRGTSWERSGDLIGCDTFPGSTDNQLAFSTELLSERTYCSRVINTTRFLIVTADSPDS